MTVSPPPIQEKTTNSLGVFPQVWLGWFNDLKICLNDLIDRINGHIYWFDYNDTATSTTPISHTGGASNTYMTNDGLGLFSNSYNPKSKNDVWNTTTNSFDFSGLKIGDTVFIRFDFEVTNSVNNQEVEFFIALGIGGFPYELQCTHRYDKSPIGVKYMTFVYEVYMGDENTLNNPAKCRFYSDGDADIKVNGWYVRVISV